MSTTSDKLPEVPEITEPPHLEHNPDLTSAQPSPPPTPPSHPSEDHLHPDLVDDPAAWSDSRQFPRGGRKQKTASARKAPPSEKTHVPWSQRNGRLASFADPTPEEDDAPEYEESDADSPVPEPPAEKGKGKGKEKERLRPKPSPFKSGISSFGIKRSKTGPPIGIHVDRGDEPNAPPTKKNGVGKKEGKCSKCAAEIEVDEESSSEESKEPATAERTQDEPKEPPRKPVQIRLDLNLELEILLRAKIKGDITITFLE